MLAWLHRLFRLVRVKPWFGTFNHLLPARRLRLEPLEARRMMAVFTVDNTNDSGPGSLRQAILDANGAAGPDTIEFDQATFVDNGPNTILLTSGQLAITDSVEITGPGAELLSIDGNASSRIFHLYNGMSTLDVTISGLTITNGAANIGGGIVNFDENLTLVDSVVTGNTATGDGGGLWLDGFNMNVTIRRTVISNNVSGNDGGGIYVEDTGGVLLIEDSTITGNNAIGDGGGIYLYDPDHSVIIRRSTIDTNMAGNRGGGIYLYSFDNGQLIIENSTISGNTASIGGGIYLYNVDNGLTIRNSTIANNTNTNGMADTGAGLAIYSLYGNNINLISNVIAGNTTNGNPDDLRLFSGGPFSTVTNNLIQAMPANTFDNTPVLEDNIIGGNPLLRPLANNGGLTRTHAFHPFLSPLLNTGADPADLQTDQRGTGFDRVVQGAPDIGAFEASDRYTTNGTTLTINGTAGDDDIRLIRVSATVYGIVFNGTELFSVNTTQFDTVAIVGGGGRDTFVLVGAADVQETMGVSNNFLNYSVSGLTVTCDAEVKYLYGQSDDSIIMFDSAGDDVAYLLSSFGYMFDSGNTYVIQPIGFGSITATASDGNDVVVLVGSAGGETVTMNTTGTSATIQGVALAAEGFEGQVAIAGGTGDTVNFDGSADDETFVHQDNFFVLANSNGNYQLTLDFSNAIVDGAGGSNSAILYDSAGDDTFTASPTQATLQTDNVFVQVSHFALVYAISTAGGNDTATLDGSNGDDIFYGSVDESILYQPDTYIIGVQGYASVEANLTMTGGDDTAILEDSAGDDAFSGAGLFALLVYGNGNQVRVENFDTVFAFGENGGTNTRDFDDVGYELIFVGTFA